MSYLDRSGLERYHAGVKSKIKNLRDIIAEEYDSTAVYTVGDLCVYDGGLYVCTTAITTAEAWTAAHWTAVTVGEEISDLKETLNQKYTKPSTGIPVSDLASGVIPNVSGKADKVQNATSGNFASLDANGNLTDSGHKHSDYLTEAPVTDVQVNGTSVLSDGVANIPVASANEFGAVKINAGSTAIGLNSSGVLGLTRANEAQIKGGTNFILPFTVSNQHIATFYGLAKAAGDATQSASSNAVGTYTEEAKIAIQKMLGIYEAPWELIREDTFTNATQANHTISVDGNGETFELTDAIILFELPKQNNDASVGGSGAITFGLKGLTDVGNPIVEIGGWTQAANTISRGGVGVFLQHGKLIQVYRVGQNSSSNTGMYGARYGTGFGVVGTSDRVSFCLVDTVQYVTRIIINSVTGTGHYKLYGKRKWS